MTYEIIEGDVLEVLRGMPDASFDAVLTDPPAGISFMGRAWDSDKGGRDEWIAWLSGVFVEVRRVCRPGAHALVWALPRTSHWTATAIENAGWTIRDVGVHLFGSGFPKSMAIDKAIDRANGDERPVHGVELRKNAPNGLVGVGRDSISIERKLTSAASAAWGGHGTALKPASEHWILARAPLSEKTVAANALRHGTGGLNIDATRIEHSGHADRESHEKTVEAIKARGGQMANSWKNSSDLAGASEVSALGRWPANLSVAHTDACVRVGARHGVRPILGADPDGTQVKSIGFTRGSIAQTLRTEVTEVTEVYECAPGCPVKLIDDQSGDCPGMSGGGAHAVDYAGGMFGAIDSTGTSRGDSGGASRFFYIAKPSQAEKSFGCGPRGNRHPTVKPIGLAKWLASMLLPPPRSDGMPRRLLNPFSGSGTEAIGSLRAGYEDVVGIESDHESAVDARERIARWLEVPKATDEREAVTISEKPLAGQVGLFGGTR